MIKIERNDLDCIAREYWDKLQEKGYNKCNKPVRTYYINNMKRIVFAKATEFKGIIEQFKKEFRKVGAESFDDFKTYMENQYKTMRNDHGYWLLKRLDIQVCPYCNRQYTFTVKKDKNVGVPNITPELDHFYPKSKHPYLALSFYNLIPSCPVCNHTKLDEIIDIHPYTDNFNNLKCHFMITTKDNKTDSLDWALEKDIKITFTDNNVNIEVLALKELYNEHIDYVEEIINKAQAYNSQYYISLIDAFKGLGKQPAEIDRFVWGKYLEEAEHEKRPLSKLTKDILAQLKIK